MKTLNSIFDTVDSIFRLVVIALFGAMVLGFASCSESDDEPEIGSDEYVASIYSLAIKMGVNPNIIVFRGESNGTTGEIIPDSLDLQNTIDNILIPGILNDPTTQSFGVQMSVMCAASSQSAQELMFGTAYFTFESLEGVSILDAMKKTSFEVLYNNHSIQLTVVDNNLEYTINY